MLREPSSEFQMILLPYHFFTQIDDDDLDRQEGIAPSQ